MSGVLAKPPGECCLKGAIHEGEPAGKVSKISDLETYVAEPAAGKGNGHVILYFPDVFGHYTNSKLLADGFAGEGYVVVMPDYFRGDTIDKYLADGKSFDKGFKEGFDFAAWAGKHKSWGNEVLPKWVETVKSTYGKAETKFGATGYCWGAPYVCEQLSAKGICSAGVFAHPASLDDSHIDDLTKPLLLSCAETDNTFPSESRRKAVDALMKAGKKFQVQLFQGVAHGFAVKANLDDPWEKYVKEQAFQGAVDWFNFWLK